MIRDAGFDATSVWWEEDHARGRRLRHLAPGMVRKAGLTLDNVHVPYNRCAALWSADASERKGTVEKHVEWVEDCARHGIARMVMHVNLGRGVPVNSHGVDSLLRILEIAESKGIEIAIENTRHPCYVDYLLQEIPSPLLTFCYDCSHDWLYSGEPFALLERWRHRLSATHLSDTDGILDRHWLPGEGVIDFEKMGEAFPAPTYDGCYMLEVVARDKEEKAAGFLGRAREALMSTIERLTKGVCQEQAKGEGHVSLSVKADDS